MKSTNIFIWIILLCSFTVLQAQWVDHFDNVCGLDEWQDVQLTEGWNIQALEIHDISLSSPGYLTMMPSTVTWYADYRGPLLFKMVSNDFVLTGRVSVSNRQNNTIPGSAYSLGGFMVRNPKTLINGLTGWIPGEEDYVFLSIGSGSTNHPSCPGCQPPHFEVKSTTNSNSILNLSSITSTEAEIRLIRLAPYVLVLYRLPANDWIVHRRYYRPDLEIAVQVGMVTYTDWDKGSTYTMPFHNSHVLNDDLNPDPSNNPSLPFVPDIISNYDFTQCLPTNMPVAWVGHDLLNENDISNVSILSLYGNTIAIPLQETGRIWIGRTNQDWNTSSNWMSGVIPGATDTVRVQACDCPAGHCLIVPSGTSTIARLHVHQGATLTIPVNAELHVNGPLWNEGTIIIYGQLHFYPGANQLATNLGTIDCREGGMMVIHD